MISIKQINEEDIDLCYELDSNTISLWSKKQWAKELKKEGVKSFCLLISNLVIGICVFHVVLDEAQINFFVINIPKIFVPSFLNSLAHCVLLHKEIVFESNS